MIGKLFKLWRDIRNLSGRHRYRLVPGTMVAFYNVSKATVVDGHGYERTAIRPMGGDEWRWHGRPIEDARLVCELEAERRRLLKERGLG